ncbi:MAG: hypothetical protein AAF639_35590 [Chloroflexota bacterium]
MKNDEHRDIGELLEQHRLNLRLLELEASHFGAGERPLKLLNQIYAEKKAIEALEAEIAALEECSSDILPDADKDVRATIGRWLLLASVVLVAIVAVTFAAVRFSVMPPSSPCAVEDRQRPCLLVADLAAGSDGRGGTHNETAQKIVKRLVGELEDDSSTVHVATITTPVDSVEEAKQMLRKTGAWLLLWGDLTIASPDEHITSQLKLYITLTDQLGIDGATTIRPERTEPLTYSHFTIDINCGENINQPSAQPSAQTSTTCDLTTPVEPYLDIIHNVAIGLLRYADDKPEEAVGWFEGALEIVEHDLHLDLREVATNTLDAQTIPSDPAKVNASLDDITCTSPIRRSTKHFDTSLLHYYTGKAHILRGSYERALHHLAYAVTEQPCDPATWFAIAELYHRWIGSSNSMMPDEVVMALDKAKDAADILHGSTDYQDQHLAIGYQRGLIEEFRGDIYTHTHADATLSKAHYHAAADHYRAALRTIPAPANDPRTYVTYITLGRVLRKLGDKDTAHNLFHHAQVIDSRAPWAYLEKARTLADNRVEAEQLLAQAEMVAPKQMAVALTRAELCAVAWQDQECAIHAYHKAESLKPGSGWLHSKIGDFYRTAYDPPWWRKSVEHYAQVERLRPDDPWTHVRLGEALFYRGEFVAAAESFEKAMSLSYAEAYAETHSPAYRGWVCNAKAAYEQAGILDRAEGLVCDAE